MFRVGMVAVGVGTCAVGTLGPGSSDLGVDVNVRVVGLLCGTGAAVVGIKVVVRVPAEDVTAAQESLAEAVGVGQSPKKQAMPPVASAQASTRPLVMSPHPAVTSETTTPETWARSSMMVPSSISLKRLAASVTTDWAASSNAVGRVTAILITSPNVPITSSGRSVIRSGTRPCCIWVTKFSASSASFSSVWMILQGIRLAYSRKFLDRSRPRSSVLGVFSECVEYQGLE